MTSVPQEGGLLVSKPATKSAEELTAAQNKLADGAKKMLAVLGSEDVAVLEEPLKVHKVAERTSRSSSSVTLLSV